MTAVDEPHPLSTPMKRKKSKCPLTAPGQGDRCPLEKASVPAKASDSPHTVVVRTERRSWITVAITGFGALLLRYLQTVRERERGAANL